MRKFIELLESQLGYSEKAGAYTKFGNWYGETIEFDADYTSAPWCDMFLAWAATKLGYEEWMGQFAWTVAHAKWFKKQDAWGTKPEPGAFVFFDWGGSDSISRIDHIGVVTKVEGGRIHTIEGNIDGGVAKRKERDTSKVVGYGYPWKIKERLDAEAAQKAADEAAAMEAKTDDGLATLVPHVELDGQAKTSSGSRPGKERDKKGETPKAGRSDAPKKAEAAPQTAVTPGAGEASAPRTGKHAKPSTADTSAVTTGPIPVITDVAATGPSTTVDSPALLTSALVAALAVLAVAKARTLRLRPALAGAAAVRDDAPRSHRRRKPRKEARTPSARPLQEPMELDAPRPLVDGLEPVTALRSLRTLFPHEPIVIPEATSPFDAFSRPTRTYGSTTRPALTTASTTAPALVPAPVLAEPEQPVTLVWEHDGSTRRLITDTGPIEIPREPGLYELPDPYSGFHLLGGASGPFPIREEPVLPRRPHATSSGTHPGRGHALMTAPSHGERLATDAPLRGRRHRQSVDVQRLEPLTPDAPLRGRRHRTAHDPTGHDLSRSVPYEPAGRTHDGARHLSHRPDAAATRAYEPALAGASRTADHAPPARDTRTAPAGRRGSRRGRHRA
ncbi:CHAP domain-containing protein [Nonomuraea sp. MCN248]|uniref:CHAP domain-containing protein n=1 Tax=Nonomuraea corallina TaxID=2989783 RepID=A0ABT4SLL3_9ACTN|nr:CHAP domain-containing protein [Nonomuraea corallina]MDA0638128.1 CHAP domain-containing protein [Nonomuraea corallina]